MRSLRLLLLLLLPLASGAAAHAAGRTTTSNDDSCEIGVTPAATLFIPYFEVGLGVDQTAATTTLFTITNTSPQPQIARATLWTDWGFAAYSFDIFLTGYDVASVNLYDLFERGKLPVTPLSAPGRFSENANANHAATMPFDCSTRPSEVPPFVLRDLRALFTIGRATGAGISCPTSSTQQQVGSNHGANAAGYITIDVVASCGPAMPGQVDYFVKDLLYDNVLIGDWMMVHPNKDNGNYAAGAPMVHIRAMPEGGPAGANVETNLPFTFHNRLTNLLPAHYSRMMDRRQPLPVTYAARFIQGGSSSFDTRFAIWSEPATGAGATCTSYFGNANKAITELIRFDEHENANVFGNGPVFCVPGPGNATPALPTASLLSSTAPSFPSMFSPAGDIAGWMYMNLSHGGSAAYTVNSGNRDFKTNAAVFPHCSRHNQAYVMTVLAGDGRYAAMFDAAALANGCSKAPFANLQRRTGDNATP